LFFMVAFGLIPTLIFKYVLAKTIEL
jgi:hypothetical protein